MSAINRFHEAANDALVTVSDLLPPEAKLTLVIYTPGKPEQDIVFKGPGVDADEVLNTLRRRGGLSLDGQNLYKRLICDAAFGALAYGKQDSNTPPAGHWLQEFWDLGRGEGLHQAKLIEALQQVTDCLSKALTGGSVPAAEAGRALVVAGDLLRPHRT
ncbi:hypothetical protein HB13667_07970 [Pseudomonas putida]|uniref:Uncharacterized protein n=1 Tax=Pseudomonas putida TaxID=303 RepID=A0A0P7DF86_PSEPU|nr:hypothetical protein [Pseudomonas putida]KPM66858.1 hypothetical protein HB13667_07970 [Pseudomonas putida]